jgi:hypothetical protein
MATVRWRRVVWSALAVWVIFWSVYPALGRPKAIAAAVRQGDRDHASCLAVPQINYARSFCFIAAEQHTRAALKAITFSSEYVGYATWWVSVGLCIPMVVALLLVTKKRPLQA